MTISLEKRELNRRGDVFLLRGFLAESECRTWIACSEQTGYETATITTARGPKLAPDTRNNDRLILDDPGLAAAWWARAQAHLPAAFGRWQACGFNERFRFYRYQPGQRFSQHRDGSFERNASESSWLTFLVYLNDQSEGGQTTFDLAGEPDILTVLPEAGTALVFPHDRLHAGTTVTSGIKYVLRTDVMYRRAS